jgi:hypothetical protein
LKPTKQKLMSLNQHWKKYFTDDSDQEIDLGMLLQRLKERRPRSKVTFDDVKLIVELLG